MCVALVAGFAKVPDLHVNKCTMTQTLQGDGFGSQFQDIISTAVFAQTLNKHFCVTPIESMEHNYDNRSTFVRS